MFKQLQNDTQVTLASFWFLILYILYHTYIIYYISLFIYYMFYTTYYIVYTIYDINPSLSHEVGEMSLPLKWSQTNVKDNIKRIDLLIV